MSYVRVEGVSVIVPITVQAAAYATGELIGGKLTIPKAIPEGVTVGIIQTLTLVDQANQKVPIDVVFFRSDPSGTTFTENGALDVADADMLKIVGVVSILASDYVAFNDNAVAVVNPSRAVHADDGSTLYACLCSRGAPTYAATTDLQMTLEVI
jgi:hypothetical protein